MAVAGLVLGILSIVTAFVYIGVILGILGLIFSCIANKRGKSGMTIAGIICSIIGIALSIICIASAPKTGQKSGSTASSAIETTSTEASQQESDTSAVDSTNLADQMDTTLYAGPSSIDGGYAALYVKNNADIDVDIEVTFTARDSGGNAIGSASDEEYAVAAGQDVLLLGYFDTYQDDATCEYSMKVNEATTYKSMHDSISVTENETDNGLVFTATNNSDKDAYFVEAKAVFLKGDKLADVGSTYLINDSDSALNPGQTLSGEIDNFGEEYDNVIYTYTARDE